MTFFMRSGPNFIPTPDRGSVVNELPTGNYLVRESIAGLFFSAVDPFEAPPKLYGNVQERADRILRTFLDRPRATGALFAGEKGSGKSQLARVISTTGIDMGIPTIIINDPWTGDAFGKLLADVEQPAIVLMDEFEKVYDRKSQEQVLTLLDGMMTSQKLFVLTVNDKYAVSDHMRNRPGRLFYSLDFNGLEPDFIREYLEDTLLDKEQIEPVVRVSSMFSAFNFDILKALVEEMNRYGEDPFKAMEMLNASPITDSFGVSYTVKVWDDQGRELDYEETYDEHPLQSAGGARVWLYNKFEKDEDGDQKYMRLVMHPTDLRNIDGDKGVFEFETEEKYRVVFSKKPAAKFDPRSY